MATRRDFDNVSNASFFSRVIEDIQVYRAGTRLHNEENLDIGSKPDETTVDDNYRQQIGSQALVSEFTLTATDFYLYIIGMLIRI